MRPTSLGRVVTDLLVAAFPDILEVELHRATGGGARRGRRGQGELGQDAASAFTGRSRSAWARPRRRCPTVKRKGLPTELKCELDGGEMVIKWGRNGEFLACSNYPKCTNTKEFTRDDQGNIMPQESPALATDRPTRFARNAASRWCGGARASASSSDARAIPTATASSGCKSDPVNTGVTCPDCKEGDILERRSRRGKILLRMRPLSEVQVRELGQGRAAAVPGMRRDLPGREDHQARRRALAMPQQGMRLPRAGAGRRGARWQRSRAGARKPVRTTDNRHRWPPRAFSLGRIEVGVEREAQNIFVCAAFSC